MLKVLRRLEVTVGLSLEDLISAIKALDETEREFLIENLLAATSPDYLKSIEEAREDYRQGRVLSSEEGFN
ncbi:MAG TPA: hypothetical protein ENI60_04880 [Candidatus Fraserbacteria bacterium]|nr:hypothetical protein [Candidatus Fraserbacteria bacterium]